MAITEDQLKEDFTKLQLAVLSGAVMNLIKQGKLTGEDLAAAIDAQDKPGLLKLAEILYP